VPLRRFDVSLVCARPRASQLTGRYNFRRGVVDVFGAAFQLDPVEVTLAESLGDADYPAGIPGKWHLGDGAIHRSNEQGFNEALVHTGPALRNWACFLAHYDHDNLSTSKEG
jgi:arylsulfatase A-like enzyme